MRLIQRITPKPGQATSCQPVIACVEHRPHTVEAHAETRSGHYISQKITESMVAQIPARAPLEDAPDFLHHSRFIGVGNRHITDHTVKRLRLQRHVLRRCQDHGQVGTSTIRQRARIHVKPDGYTSMFHELLQLFAVAAPNVDHNRPRRETGLCIGQRVSLPGESISTGHTPIFRRGTRQRQDRRP